MSGNNLGKQHFPELFYHVTLHCNLRCSHCYIDPDSETAKYEDFDVLKRTLVMFHEIGARKFVILGGEPTLYAHYAEALEFADSLGYKRIIVDTNGLSSDVLPDHISLKASFVARFSIDGADAATHDMIRGQGSFDRLLPNLHAVIAKGIKTEVTCTVNAININQLAEFVARFGNINIDGMNFHFTSPIGRAQTNQSINLNADMILAAQDCLENLRAKTNIPIRYPKMLVTYHEMEKEIENGYHCNIFEPSRSIFFPGQILYRCPLQFTPGFIPPHGIRDIPLNRGCFATSALFPGGLPDGYVMTCISWKSKTPFEAMREIQSL